MTRAPVDRTEIRQLAADPEVILTIKVINDFFNGLLRACPEQAEKPGIEDCWSLIKKGLLRLYDPEIDEDDDMIIREAATPGQRQRARIEGAKLFAVRQHIKRQVREAARRR